MSRLLTAVLVGSALLGSGAARADAFTQTVTFGPGLTDFSSNTGDTTFSYFNSSVGMLTSITLTARFGFTSNIKVTAESSSSGTAFTQAAAQFGASDTAVNSVFASQLDNQGSFSTGTTTLNPVAFKLLGSGGGYSITGAGSQTVTSNAATQADGPITDVDLGDLNAFVGNGTFNATFSTLTGTLLASSGGNASATQTTTATGSITLVYNYTQAPPSSVPEPASLAVLGASLLGAGLLRRRAR